MEFSSHDGEKDDEHNGIDLWRYLNYLRRRSFLWLGSIWPSVVWECLVETCKLSSINNFVTHTHVHAWMDGFKCLMNKACTCVHQPEPVSLSHSGGSGHIQIQVDL